MCVYMCVYMYVYVNVCVYMYMCYMHMYLCVDVCIYIPMPHSKECEIIQCLQHSNAHKRSVYVYSNAEDTILSKYSIIQTSRTKYHELDHLNILS